MGMDLEEVGCHQWRAADSAWHSVRSGNDGLAGFTIGGKNIMDMEDFLVSNNLLPLGSLVYLLFCVTDMAGDGTTLLRKPMQEKV